MKYTFFHLPTLILLLTLPFSGCGPKLEPAEAQNAVEIKVAFWGSPEEIEIVTKSMEEWR
jgi:hypothetical protein